jgi:hypothetical protein
MGVKGRAWTTEAWAWQATVDRLKQMLAWV